MSQINWDCPKDEIPLIVEICKRAMKELTIEDEWIDLSMDITACHLNGTKLDLQKLLNADKFNFAHDVQGIRSHINRSTGKIMDCFLPRCSKS